MHKKSKTLAIVGPTGIGKSRLALELASRFEGEIINADSMQVYQELMVGTARPSEAEKSNVPHHLYGHISVTKEYSSAEFQQEGRKAIQLVHSRGHLPIIVGGSGLYLRTLLYDVRIDTRTNFESARRLESEYSQNGIEPLVQRLREWAPEVADKTDLKNPRRVIKALAHLDKERADQDNGKTSEQRTDLWTAEALYDQLIIGITTSRQELRDSIKIRFERMLEQGLLQEVRSAYFGGLTPSRTALQAIGYKEFFPFIAGHISLETAVDKAVTATCKYAKRQMTWFNKEPSVIWIEIGAGGFSALVNEAISQIGEWKKS